MAPIQSQAGVVSKKQSATIEHTTHSATIFKRAASSELYADPTHLNYLRSSNTQIRSGFLVKFLPATAVDIHAIGHRKSSYSTPSFLQCVPIGLLLIFPQHYFW